jgi:predicted nucleotidyltransferase
LLEPGREESLTGLAHRLGADVGTVQREVSRLERAGILRTRRVGQTRLAAANVDSPIYAPLTEIVLKTFGPLHVVAEEFAGIERMDEIFLFGSWAARYRGEEGPEPADLDVLVIGRPSRDALYQAALRAERRLGRQVNVTVRSKASWESAQDGFVKEVRRSPFVGVPGTKSEETARR